MKAHTDNPLVSVIVPNYNHAKYLPERLSSIINQSFQDFELIILDDASTDNSLEVISKYVGNLPHRLVVNDKNSGSVFRQWDKGISLAEGELIWIAESDDVAEPTLLEKAVKKLLSCGAVLAYCQSLIIDSDGDVIGNVKGWTDEYDPKLWNNDFIMDGVKFCANFLSIKCVMPNASAVVFRRKLYINPLTILPHLKLTGDYLFWAHLAMQGDIAYIAEPLNKFRRHYNTVRMGQGANYLPETIDVSAWILEKTHAYENKDITHFMRHHLFSLWLSIGLEPASPFNWFQRKKAYEVLYKLYGVGLLLVILRSFPKSFMRTLKRKLILTWIPETMLHTFEKNMNTCLFQIRDIIKWFSKTKKPTDAQKKISIIIPTLSKDEHAGHLPMLKRLLSVYLTRQSHKNYEALVYCDGPNQKVEKMVSSLNDPRISVYSTDTTIGKWGHPQTRMGIEKAAGDFFVRMNDDNKPYRHYLQTLINGFDRDTGVVYGRIIYKGEARRAHDVGMWRSFIKPSDKDGTLRKNNLDCMNYMVRSELAKQYVSSWNDNFDADWRFLEAMLKNGVRVRFVDRIIGEKY